MKTSSPPAYSSLPVCSDQTVVELDEQASTEPATSSWTDKLYAGATVIGGTLLFAGACIAAKRLASSAASSACSLATPGNGSMPSHQGLRHMLCPAGNSANSSNVSNSVPNGDPSAFTQLRSFKSAAVSDPLDHLSFMSGAFSPLFDGMTGRDKVNVGTLKPLSLELATELSSRLSEVKWQRQPRHALKFPQHPPSHAELRDLATRVVEFSRTFILENKDFVPGLLSKIDTAKKEVARHTLGDTNGLNYISLLLVEQRNKKREEDDPQIHQKRAAASAELARLEGLLPDFDRFVSDVNKLRV